MAFNSRLEWTTPEKRLDAEFFGIVVDNNDPDKSGKVKVWISEMFEKTIHSNISENRTGEEVTLSSTLQHQTIEHIPWADSKDLGGHSELSQSLSIPQLFTPVKVTFPDGDIYHPEYEIATFSDINPVTILGERYPDTLGKVVGSLTNIFSWFKFHRDKSEIEIFLGDNRLLVDFSESNNLRIYVDGDVTTNITGHYLSKIGKDYGIKVEGKHMTDVTKDIGVKAANISWQATTDIGMKATKFRIEGTEVGIQSKVGIVGDTAITGKFGASGDAAFGAKLSAKDMISSKMGVFKDLSAVSGIVAPGVGTSPGPAPSILSAQSPVSGATSVIAAVDSQVTSSTSDIDTAVVSIEDKIAALEAIAQEATTKAEELKAFMEEITNGT